MEKEKNVIFDIGALITSSPEIRNGQPRIAGTGVTVMRIVGWYKMGYDPVEIADEYDHISLAQVHAALTYYHINQDEIEAFIAAEEELWDELERERRRKTRELA